MPASDKEKEYMVQMRPSTTFFKDGVKRLYKNKVAFVSFIIIVLIALSSIIIPMFWPYSYETQLGVQPGKPVDSSYNNLAPFEYGRSEQQLIESRRKRVPAYFRNRRSRQRLLYPRDLRHARFTGSPLLRKYYRAVDWYAGRLDFGLFRRQG